ncbi:MAG: SMP-30/gluconolactonase/LRE family protein [Bryobacterales bacterium]|nr:SMP-30/gluconolactonase/LRE family protein [Bryobacterales bacterium]
MNWQWEVLDPPYGGVSEGPVWDGRMLLYTRIQQSRIMRYDPAGGEVSVWKENTNCANGLAYDGQGRLYACVGGADENSRRVVRYESDGRETVLADGYGGKRFNIPNDLVVDAALRVWFTDPFYENAAGPWSADRSEMDLDHESVYRLDPQADGSHTVTRLTFDTTRPNGLLFSKDGSVLYVAQSGRLETEKRQLRAYPVRENLSLGEAKVLHDFGAHRGIDGMCLDGEGNIVATAGWELGGPGPSIYVFAPDGTVLQRHDVPCKRPTNCCFAEGGTLYVTTIEGYLLRTETGR